MKKLLIVDDHPVVHQGLKQLLSKEAELPMRATIIALPLAVFAIEIAQLWIPGQESSITEPALALTIVCCMHALAKERAATLQRARTR